MSDDLTLTKRKDLQRKGWEIVNAVYDLAINKNGDVKHSDQLSAARLIFSVIGMVPGAHPMGSVPNQGQAINATNIQVNVGEVRSKKNRKKQGKDVKNPDLLLEGQKVDSWKPKPVYEDVEEDEDDDMQSGPVIVYRKGKTKILD